MQDREKELQMRSHDHEQQNYFSIFLFMYFSMCLEYLFFPKTSCYLRSLVTLLFANSNILWTGGVFTENERDGPTELAFKYAVYRINRDRTLLPNMTLLFDIQYTPKDDSFHATKKGE